jgi:hypothetical protein
MNKKKRVDDLERRIKRLRKQIKALLRYAYYFTPPLPIELPLRISKM